MRGLRAGLVGRVDSISLLIVPILPSPSQAPKTSGRPYIFASNRSVVLVDTCDLVDKPHVIPTEDYYYGSSHHHINPRAVF